MKIVSKNIIGQIGPLIGLVFVIVLFMIISPAEFHSFYNIKTILTQSVIIGIAALGMTIIIISGGIDLSVGSQIALGTIVTATLLIYFGGESDAVGNVAVIVSALLGIVACVVCGWLIGVIISKFKLAPFIVTLGMMQIARGVAKWIGSEKIVTTPENNLWKFMLVDPEPKWMIFAPGVWIMIILLILTTIMLKKTVLGRYIFAIGSNEQTAILCGVNVKKVKVIIYALGSLFVGIAAIMQYGNLTVGDPTAAIGMELDIIAAVVIGGGSLNGGEGSATGSIIGALIMAVLRNGCNMLGVPNYIQEIIIGAIIVGAVLIDRLKHGISKA